MAVSDIFTDFQNYGFTDFSNTTMFPILNQVQQDVCGLEPWPFLNKVTTGNFTATARQFNSTTDIKQVLSIVNTTQNYELIPYRDADSFYKDYSNSLTLTGTPLLYYTPVVNTAAPMGWQVNVWPIPTALDTYQLRYVYVPPTLTLTTDIPVIPDRYSRLLVLGMLVHAYEIEDDLDAAAVAEQRFDRYVARMKDDLFSTDYDRNDTIQNVTDDGFDYTWGY